MPSERTCKTCRWWDSERWPHKDERGERRLCRRYPPVMDDFPLMFGNDWCGEWTDRPMPAAKNPDRGSMFYRDEP